MVPSCYSCYKAVDKSRARTESDYEYDERNIRGHLLRRYSVKVMQESDYEYDERNIHGHLLRRYSVKVMQVMLAPVKLSKRWLQFRNPWLSRISVSNNPLLSLSRKSWEEVAKQHFIQRGVSLKIILKSNHIYITNMNFRDVPLLTLLLNLP